MENTPIMVYVIVGIVAIVAIWKSLRISKKKKKSLEFFDAKLIELSNSGYEITKQYINRQNELMFGINEQKKEFFAIKLDKELKYFSFDKILDCKVSLNGDIIEKSSAANVVGGAVLAGGIGALIGASIKKKSIQKLNYTGLSLTLDDLTFPKLDLCFAKDNVHQCNQSKKELAEWHGVFKIIIERNRREQKG